MVKSVVMHPNKVLTQKSQKAVIDASLTALIQDMQDTVNSFKDPIAAGLSAVQIGLPQRVVLARDFVEDPATRKHIITQYILVNPKLVGVSKEKLLDWEGCLSFPDLYGKVERHKKIKVRFQDIQGVEQRLTAAGFLARVIQHEMDHLDGITFDTKIQGKMYKGAELDEDKTVA